MNKMERIMEELRKKIDTVLTEYTGRWGIVVLNHSNGRKLEINSQMVFPSASMIKVPIMFEVMRQAAAKTISLDQTLIVKDKFRVGGAGILKELRPDIPMTIQELITLMIILSDNTATNMLIDLVGVSSINTTMTDLGLKTTVLRRYMMDFDAALAGKENDTSAADLVLLFAAIYDSLELPSNYSALMLDILTRQKIQDKLPFYLPEGTRIAHKTGTLPGVEHDGGILFLPSGPYIICILTADLAVNFQGLQLVSRIGKVIYEHFHP
jgi:beta-lactamase class A